MAGVLYHPLQVNKSWKWFGNYNSMIGKLPSIAINVYVFYYIGQQCTSKQQLIILYKPCNWYQSSCKSLWQKKQKTRRHNLSYNLLGCMAKYNVSTIHTFGESQFLRDSACDFWSSGVTVEIHLVHTVPVHMCPAQLQTMDGCRVAGREEKWWVNGRTEERVKLEKQVERERRKVHGRKGSGLHITSWEQRKRRWGHRKNYTTLDAIQEATKIYGWSCHTAQSNAPRSIDLQLGKKKQNNKRRQPTNHTLWLQMSALSCQPCLHHQTGHYWGNSLKQSHFAFSVFSMFVLQRVIQRLGQARADVWLERRDTT